jgi:hypothetical protein
LLENPEFVPRLMAKSQPGFWAAASRCELKPKPTENPSAFLLGMIGTLYDRPQGYAQTIGELNSLLWFAHLLWSGVAGRRSDFVDVRSRNYDEEFARQCEELRLLPISDKQALAVIVDLWRRIDSEVGINTDPDQFDETFP